MRRGGHKIKPAKAATVPEVSATLTVPTRTNSEGRRSSLLPPALKSRNSSEVTVGGSTTSATPSRESSRHRTTKLEAPSESRPAVRDADSDKVSKATSESVLDEAQCSTRPVSTRLPTIQATESEDADETVLVSSESTDSTQSSAPSSIFSADSTSIYSRSSSIYSREASLYSFDECSPDEINPLSRKDTEAREASVGQSSRTSSVRRQEPQDAASQERSTLAKKAAMFKNSRLPPSLPPFSVSLPTWAMVCRAVQASQDCYSSRALTRQGTYTAADTSKDIKAMIVDDQLIDGSRLVIVAIRGTEFQCIADWAANADAKPVKPVGFLDDEDNACHNGFLLVAKAMVKQVASQLKQHPASSERPSLLFTGHSAGGAIAAMLYSHMLSTSVDSELTALASQFPIIHCVTFGAPPLSMKPLPRRDNGSGVFLTFANEGDPVLRMGNAAYFKTLAKLKIASPPPQLAAAIAPPPVKVVRGSRGATVYRQALAPAPSIPWEELPLWPTPPGALTNGGDIVILRDKENGHAVASRVVAEDVEEVIFADLVQHTMAMYTRRVKELALAAMMGRSV